MITVAGKTREELAADLARCSRAELVEFVVSLVSLEEHLTAAEISRRLGIPKRAVCEAMNAGKIGGGYYCRGANSKRVPVSAVHAWWAQSFVPIGNSNAIKKKGYQSVTANIDLNGKNVWAKGDRRCAAIRAAIRAGTDARSDGSRRNDLNGKNVWAKGDRRCAAIRAAIRAGTDARSDGSRRNGSAAADSAADSGSNRASGARSDGQGGRGSDSSRPVAVDVTDTVTDNFIGKGKVFA